MTIHFSDLLFFLSSLAIGYFLYHRRKRRKRPKAWTPPPDPVRQPHYGDPDYIASIDD